MPTRRAAPGHYLIASDFDQTLSFHDSGIVLSELIGVSNVRAKVSGLSDIHLVQQGAELQVRAGRASYVGDGSCDLHVLLHGNNGGGFTIAVSEATHITRLAQRIVVSDNALSVLVPVLEEVVGWAAARIRQLFASCGLVLQEWDKARTDWVTLREYPEVSVGIIRGTPSVV